MRRAAAARRSAHGGRGDLLLGRARAPRTLEGPALMQAPQRYPELFLAPPERTPDSFWISLGYFNLYRITVATLFLTLSFMYEDALNLGSHSLQLFRFTCGFYLAGPVLFHVALRRFRQLFNVQLSLHPCADVCAITLLLNPSGGGPTGLSGMLALSSIGAALVPPGPL